MRLNAGQADAIARHAENTGGTVDVEQADDGQDVIAVAADGEQVRIGTDGNLVAAAAGPTEEPPVEEQPF